jgi:hypothetical protein
VQQALGERGEGFVGQWHARAQRRRTRQAECQLRGQDAGARRALQRQQALDEEMAAAQQDRDHQEQGGGQEGGNPEGWAAVGRGRQEVRHARTMRARP